MHHQCWRQHADTFLCLAPLTMWRQILLPHRAACGAILYVCPRKYNKTSPVVEDDKWEALTRIASLLPESDIELQHVGGHAVVSRRLSDGSLQPWGVAPLPVGEPLPRGA